MASFGWKKNIENSIKDGLIITTGATRIFFGVKVANIKLPSLDAMFVVCLCYTMPNADPFQGVHRACESFCQHNCHHTRLGRQAIIFHMFLLLYWCLPSHPCAYLSVVKIPLSLLTSIHVSNYNATFSPVHLVFLELEVIHQSHLDFKALDENNNEVIPRTFYLQLLNKEWVYMTMKPKPIQI